MWERFSLFRHFDRMEAMAGQTEINPSVTYVIDRERGAPSELVLELWRY